MPTALLLDEAQDTVGSDLDIDLQIADLELPGHKTPSLDQLTEGNCWATADCCSAGGSMSTLRAAAMCLLC